jgi:glycosyltransferase involved in cell wall biosynthesis
MTVYDRVHPTHFAEALDSVARQTLAPAELVLVADGPLTPGLDEVLERFDPPFPVRVVRLGTNVGAGLASAAGLEDIQAEWLARFDADDISAPHRLQRQVEVLADAEGSGEPIDVLGTDMREFSDDASGAMVGIRALPRSDAQIRRYARLNSPINNPTVIMRTSAVRAAGGYRHQPFMEDYDLFARMIATDCRFANLPEPLVDFRVSPAMYERRRGLAFLATEVAMQRRLRSYGLIGLPGMVRNLVLRMAYRLLPVDLLRRAHARLFHRTPTS